ncbi:hypothetical protein KNP65_09945 [Latilactobacillus curvatus]|uniref:hypothetical protein n=1 Tax=Latilactobacillus curvatus TaxID=28038 RepID=UPI0024111941|nr:hypothetical protein [Latilactobacillus curvatus]MDG2980257.1 hypothetical protein [Latilactobacillus curvatus]
MSNKRKRNIFMDDELFFNIKALAEEQQIPIGKALNMLYEQWQYDVGKETRKLDNQSKLLKVVTKQSDQIIEQTEMLIQMANTLGVKFNFNQLINTNINESGMVSEAKKFVKAKQHSEILQHQVKNHDVFND